MKLFYPSFRIFSYTVPRFPLALLLILGLGMSGCQNDTVDPSQSTTDTASPPTSDPEIAVVRGLTPGDRACYIELEDAQGQKTQEEASFELCEQTQLVGQRVQLTRVPTPIPALSCQGNPECTERDTVNLITAVEVVP